MLSMATIASTRISSVQSDLSRNEKAVKGGIGVEAFLTCWHAFGRLSLISSTSQL